MKTAAKILIIISMICSFWLIFPLIIGIKALNKMKNNEMTTGWKIAVLLCVNTLAGIFLLCSKD